MKPFDRPTLLSRWPFSGRARAAPERPGISAKPLILKRPSARAYVAPERAYVSHKSLKLQRPSRASVCPPYYVRGRGAFVALPLPGRVQGA